LSRRSGKSRAWRWVRRGLGVTLAVLTTLVLLAVAAVLIVARTDFGHETVQKQLVANLEPYVDGKATIGAIEGNLLREFSVADVAIADRQGKIIIGLRKLALRFRPSELVDKRVHVESLHLVEPLLDLSRGPDGNLSIASLFKVPPAPEDEEPMTWIIEIDDLWLQHARVDVSELVPELGVLEDVNLRGSVRVEGEHIVLDLKELSVRSTGLGERLAGHLSFDMKGPRMEVSLDLAGDGGAVSIPTAMFATDTSTLVAAVLVHVEPALAKKYAPELGILEPTDVSLMVASTGLTRFSLLSGVAARDARVAVAGTADVEAVTIAAGVALSPMRPATLVAAAPELDLAGARLSGTFDDKGEFVGLVSAQVAGYGVAQQTIQAAVEGSPKEVRARLTSEGGGARISVNGGVALGDRPTLMRTSVDARIADLGRLVGREMPIRGRLSSSLVAQGPIDDIDARGELSVTGGGYDDITATELKVLLRGRNLPDAPNGAVQIKATGLRIGEQSFQEASAQLSLGAKRDLNAELAIVSGDISASTRVAGKLEDDKVRLRINELRGKYRELVASGGGASLVAGFDGNVELRGLELRTAEGTIALGAKVVPSAAGSQIHADIDALGLRLEKLAGALGIESLHGRGSVAGSVDLGPRKNAFELMLAVDGEYQDYPPFKVSGEVELERRDLHLSLSSDVGMGLATAVVDAHIRAPAVPTDAAAWARAGRAAIDDVEVLVKVQDFGGVRRWFPDSPLIGGSLVTSIHAQDGARRAAVRVDAAGLRSLWTTDASEIHLNGDLDGSELQLAGAARAGMIGNVFFDGTVAAPADPFDAAGWSQFGISSIERLELRLKSAWPTDELWALMGVDEPPRGQAELALEFFGKDQMLGLRGELAQVFYGPLREPASAVIVARLDPKQAQTTVGLRLGNKPLVSVAASIGLSFDDVIEGRWAKLAKAPFTADVSSESIDVPRMTEKAGLGKVADGSVRFSGHAEGTLSKPRGHIEVDVSDARYEGVELKQAALVLDATDTQVMGRLKAVQVGGGHLEVEAKSGWNVELPDRQMRLHATDFEIGLLSGFGPPSMRGLGGRLFGDMTVRGKGDEVTSARGKVQLREGRVSLDGPLRKLSNITATLGAKVGELRFEAKARAGDGSLAAKAEVEMAGFVPKSLEGRVQLKRLPLATSAGIVELSLDNRIEGAFSQDEISIDVAVASGLITMPKGEGRDLHSIGPPTDVIFVDSLETGLETRPVATPSPLPPFAINIDIPQTVQLRGESINGVLGANLDITSHGGHTEFLGYAEIQRGWVKFRHRYVIERALASFDATREFNPRLDVELRHEFKTAVFSVILQGDLNDLPMPEFRSEPAIYDDGQLLSFFLGGSPDDLGRKPGTGQAAAGAATSLVTSKLTGIVQEILPLVDVLSLETSDESATPDQLLAGKWLTEKVLLAYRARLSQQTDQRTNINEATIEWWFLRRWVFEAFFGDREVGAADVLWIRRF